MKKSCFIKLVFIITILVAVIVYLVKNNFDTLFLDTGKKWLTTAIEENWEDDFNFVTNNSEKDSLKNLLIYFIDKIETTSEITDEINEQFLNRLETSLEDSIINKEELDYLTKMALRKKDEKPKSN